MSRPDRWLLCDPYCAQFKCYYEEEIEMNEEPSVTEAELARVLELDAKATQGPYAVFVGNANGRGLIRIETDATAPEAGIHIASLTRSKINEANAEKLAESANLCPRLARELAAARAAIKVKDEALTKAQWVLNNTSSNWPEQHHEARTLVTAALSHA